MSWTNISDESSSWTKDTDDNGLWGGLSNELCPDPSVDNKAAWDFQFLAISPPNTWSFDSSSLLWPNQNLADSMMIKNLITIDGVEYTASINITDYDENNSVNPYLKVTLGYSSGYYRVDLTGKPSTFNVTVTQIADNTDRATDSVLDGVDYQSVYFQAGSSFVESNSPTLRIQHFSIKRTDGATKDTWTKDTTSSTWTPVTDKSTVWS